MGFYRKAVEAHFFGVLLTHFFGLCFSLRRHPRSRIQRPKVKSTDSNNKAPPADRLHEINLISVAQQRLEHNSRKGPIAQTRTQIPNLRAEPAGLPIAAPVCHRRRNPRHSQKRPIAVKTYQSVDSR